MVGSLVGLKFPELCRQGHGLHGHGGEPCQSSERGYMRVVLSAGEAEGTGETRRVGGIDDKITVKVLVALREVKGPGMMGPGICLLRAYEELVAAEAAEG